MPPRTTISGVNPGVLFDRVKVNASTTGQAELQDHAGD
jgi:hypothetical protein